MTTGASEQNLRCRKSSAIGRGVKGMNAVQSSSSHSLHPLLHAELAAAEACAEALPRFQGTPCAKELKRIQQEHREAANELRRFDYADSESNSRRSTLVKKLLRMARRLRSTSYALSSVREAEEGCFRVYKDAVFEDSVPVECQALVWSDLLPRLKEHRIALERLTSEIQATSHSA